MTDTIVTTDNSTVVLDTSVVQNIVTTESVNMPTIVTGLMGPPGASTVAQLTDIDKTNLVDGATLVFNEASSVWKATNRLDSQIIEAGQF